MFLKSALQNKMCLGQIMKNPLFLRVFLQKSDKTIMFQVKNGKKRALLLCGPAKVGLENLENPFRAPGRAGIIRSPLTS